MNENAANIMKDGLKINPIGHTDSEVMIRCYMVMCRNRSTSSAFTRNQPVIMQTSNEQLDIMLNKSFTGITPQQGGTFEDPLQIVQNGFKQRPIFIAPDSQCHPLAMALLSISVLLRR